MAGMIPVDGGGDQRQEAAGDEENDPETLEAEWAKRGQQEFGGISNFFALGYI